MALESNLENYGRRSYLTENEEEKRRHLFGEEDKVSQDAFDLLRQRLGRNPTEQEYYQVLPVYLENRNLGRNAIETLVEQGQKTPEALRKKAREHTGSVNSLFQQNLGRDATAAEVEHFGSLLASGDADQYTIQNFLTQLPEYRQKTDDSFRAQQRGEFEKADTNYYSNTLLPQIQQQFAQQGRSLESSGFASALAQAAKQQSQEREKYLTGLSADQYQGRTAAARSDYENYISRLYGSQDYSRQRADALSDSYTARATQLQDFNMQKSAYEDYLRRFGKRKQNVGQLVGGILGGAAGAYYGGPQGAAAGYQTGGAIGGFFG